MKIFNLNDYDKVLQDPITFKNKLSKQIDSDLIDDYEVYVDLSLGHNGYLLIELKIIPDTDDQAAFLSLSAQFDFQDLDDDDDLFDYIINLRKDLPQKQIDAIQHLKELRKKISNNELSQEEQLEYIDKVLE